MTNTSTAVPPLTEFMWKQRELADLLYKLAYGLTARRQWDADEETSQNYLADAKDILIAYPHLLSLEERDRLDPEYGIGVDPRRGYDHLAGEPFEYKPGTTVDIDGEEWSYSEDGQWHSPNYSYHIVLKFHILLYDFNIVTA